MSVKSTFTLDNQTTETIRRLAHRTGKPQSQIVREAIAYYATQDEKATPAERERWLETFDTLLARVAPRAQQAVEDEVATVRASRAGWTRRSRQPRRAQR